jgi:hypothetical protein
MLHYLYNTSFFEYVHNYYLLVHKVLFSSSRSLTYPSHKSNSKSKQKEEETFTIMNPVFAGLDSIPEELELTNFYYLSLFKESESTWSIHGLWPQTDAHNYPTYCHKVNFDPKLLEPILDKLEQYWYSQGNTLPLDEKFWKHEYEKHGSCVYTPMTELEYFKNTIELYEQALELGLPRSFYNPQTKKCLIPVNQKLEFIPPSNL